MPARRVPTQVLRLRGSWRAKQRDGEPEPPAAESCKPPAYVKGKARKAWQRIAPVLIGLGVLTTLDVDVLAEYCVCYAAWRDAAETGDVDRMLKLGTHLNRLRAVLGLTPVDRSRIKVTAKDGDEDPYLQPRVVG